MQQDQEDKGPQETKDSPKKQDQIEQKPFLQKVSSDRQLELDEQKYQFQIQEQKEMARIMINLFLKVQQKTKDQNIQKQLDDMYKRITDGEIEIQDIRNIADSSFEASKWFYLTETLIWRQKSKDQAANDIMQKIEECDEIPKQQDEQPMKSKKEKSYQKQQKKLDDMIRKEDETKKAMSNLENQINKSVREMLNNVVILIQSMIDAIPVRE